MNNNAKKSKKTIENISLILPTSFLSFVANVIQKTFFILFCVFI